MGGKARSARCKQLWGGRVPAAPALSSHCGAQWWPPRVSERGQPGCPNRRRAGLGWGGEHGGKAAGALACRHSAAPRWQCSLVTPGRGPGQDAEGRPAHTEGTGWEQASSSLPCSTVPAVWHLSRRVPLCPWPARETTLGRTSSKVPVASSGGSTAHSSSPTAPGDSRWQPGTTRGFRNSQRRDSKIHRAGY